MLTGTQRPDRGGEHDMGASTRPTPWICGYPTSFSPRPDRGGRPNASTFAVASGRSDVVPSIAATLQSR
jgi:hypothetical protein